jgi:pyrimidine-nucleoside phosphorylase
MNQPLGSAVGNALELIEAIELLHGRAPKDYYEHCLHLSAHMLVLGQRAKDLDEGRVMAQKSIDNGSALEKFRVLVQAQGGDVSYVDDMSKYARAKYVEVVNAPRSGFISQVHARIVGEASVALGAGRAKKGDPIDHAVGFLIHKKVGDKVEAGESLFEIHANDEAKLAEARTNVLSAYQFSDEFVPPLPLFYE